MIGTLRARLVLGTLSIASVFAMHSPTSADVNSGLIEQLRQQFDDYGYLAAEPDDEGSATRAAYYGELLRLLRLREDRIIIGMPPGGVDAVPPDFRIRTDGTGRFWAEWTYHNPGDYNRDGLVDEQDVADLLYSLDGVTPWWYQEGIDEPLDCDGNRDGAVDFTDVAIIAANFGNCIESYRLVLNYMDAGSSLEPRRYDTELVSTLAELHPYRSHFPLRCRSLLDSVSFSPDPDGDRVELLAVATLRGAGALDNSGSIPPYKVYCWQPSIGTGQRTSFSLSYYYPVDNEQSVRWMINGVDYREFPQDPPAALENDNDLDCRFSEPGCHLITGSIETEAGTMSASVPLAVFEIHDRNPQYATGRSEADTRYYRGSPVPGPMDGLPLELAYSVLSSFPGKRILTVETIELDGGMLLACVVDEPADPETYEHMQTGDLYLIGFSNDSTAGLTEPRLLASAVYSWAALGLAEGRPVISYTKLEDATDADSGLQLVYRHSSDAGGQAWNKPAVVAAISAEQRMTFDPFTTTSIFPAEIITLKGRPAVLSYSNANERKRLVLHLPLDKDCHSWATGQVVTTLHYTSHNTNYKEMLGSAEWQGKLAVLVHDVFIGIQSSIGEHDRYCLITADPADPKTELEAYPVNDSGVDISKLADSAVDPFFASNGDAEQLRIAALDATGDSRDNLAILSLWHRADGDLRMRALFSADGESWELTPEFPLDETARTASINSIAIVSSAGDDLTWSGNWMEITLDVETEDGPQSWFTRMPLRSY